MCYNYFIGGKMKVLINDKEYGVTIIRKNIKNTYIRFNDDGVFVVTTSNWVPKLSIKKLIESNYEKLVGMVERSQKRRVDEGVFYYLGIKYDIIIAEDLKDVFFDKDKVLVPNLERLQNWQKKAANKMFKERLDKLYELFEENIPYPKLRVRKMKTKWGVCNRKNNTVTLNLDLINRTIKEIDYVIIHELSHFVVFNHSKDFWNVVRKYCPDYKEINKMLKM